MNIFDCVSSKDIISVIYEQVNQLLIDNVKFKTISAAYHPFFRNQRILFKTPMMKYFPKRKMVLYKNNRQTNKFKQIIHQLGMVSPSNVKCDYMDVDKISLSNPIINLPMYNGNGGAETLLNDVKKIMILGQNSMRISLVFRLSHFNRSGKMKCQIVRTRVYPDCDYCSFFQSDMF